MKIISQLFIKHNTLLVVIALALFSVSSLFNPGLPPTHDGEYHVIRFFEFDKTLRDGNVYPIWASDLNYKLGVPLFLYVYPFPNYVASFLHVFNISFIDAFKLNLILGSLVGAVASYYLGNQMNGKFGGLLTSVFYTFAPYHFLDIYIRGSVGEVWALAFFPLPIIFLNRIKGKWTLQDNLLLGLTLSLVIFSHNILALMYFAFFLSYFVFIFLFIKKKKQFALSTGLGFVLALLLSAIFFIPALFEREYVVGLNTFNVLENFPEIYELIIPSWGSGFSAGGIVNRMSFQIGLANLLVILLVIAGIIFRKKRVVERYTIFLLVWFFVLCFLVTPMSAFVWKAVPFMEYFQFPWRLLSLVIFVCALLAGNIVQIYKSKMLFVGLVVFVILTTLSYSHAPYFFNRTDSHYTSRENFIYGTNSIGNAFQTKWISLQSKTPKSPAEIIRGQGKILYVSKRTTSADYDVSMSQPGTILIHTAYFPNWYAYQRDGRNTFPIENIEGRLGINLDKGKHKIHIELKDTATRRIAKYVSFLTALVVFALFLRIAVLQLFYERRNR